MCPRAHRPRIILVSAMRSIALVAVALTVADCHHSTTTTPTTYYTVGGTISGLTVSSLVLANGNATVTIGADATSWVFPTSFAPGTSYSVTVKTQPTGELCEVTSGASGMDTGSVGDVTVVCSFGEWIWRAGSTTANAAGVYGTQGTAAAGNVPGARYWTSSWTDSSGNFWLFGGVGSNAAGVTGYLNDLWRYAPSTREWTWVSGGDVDNATGVYGTLGTAAAGNVPGAREAASSWIDASGNLWLFGGVGYDSSGTLGDLNDLWRYSPSTGLWTWISGGSADNASGVYGTLGTAAAGNVPGARQAATSWIDSSGDLWLFGGVGYDSTGGVGNLNDLWHYSPATGLWTWVSGGKGDNAVGVYGAEGTAAASNIPGARYSASSWIDSSGKLYLFGGYGYDSTGSSAGAGKLNDLWVFTPSSGQWTWVSGEDVANASGIYDALGTAAAGFVPGARQAATSWIDSAGNLWLFGGVGFDSTGALGNLNDLWRFSPTTGYWTWVSGADVANASGVYGTLGTAAVSSAPGGRDSMSSWIDSAGNLWLFGGYGIDSTGTLGYLNDMWECNAAS
jgi:N-acetylneuraminic acid mutarotase